LAQAAHDYPDYPHNHIFYAQALLEAGREQDAANELNSAELVLSQRHWGAATPRWHQEITQLRQQLENQ
jgi:predicted Zn-dependent protease